MMNMIASVVTTTRDRALSRESLRLGDVRSTQLSFLASLNSRSGASLCGVREDDTDDPVKLLSNGLRTVFPPLRYGNAEAPFEELLGGVLLSHAVACTVQNTSLDVSIPPLPLGGIAFVASIPTVVACMCLENPPACSCTPPSVINRCECSCHRSQDAQCCCALHASLQFDPVRYRSGGLSIAQNALSWVSALSAVTCADIVRQSPVIQARNGSLQAVGPASDAYDMQRAFVLPSSLSVAVAAGVQGTLSLIIEMLNASPLVNIVIGVDDSGTNIGLLFEDYVPDLAPTLRDVFPLVECAVSIDVTIIELEGSSWMDFATRAVRFAELLNQSEAQAALVLFRGRACVVERDDDGGGFDLFVDADIKDRCLEAVLAEQKSNVKAATSLRAKVWSFANRIDRNASPWSRFEPSEEDLGCAPPRRSVCKLDIRVPPQRVGCFFRGDHISATNCKTIPRNVRIPIAIRDEQLRVRLAETQPPREFARPDVFAMTPFGIWLRLHSVPFKIPVHLREVLTQPLFPCLRMGICDSEETSAFENAVSLLSRRRLSFEYALSSPTERDVSSLSVKLRSHRGPVLLAFSWKARHAVRQLCWLDSGTSGRRILAVLMLPFEPAMCEPGLDEDIRSFLRELPNLYLLDIRLQDGPPIEALPDITNIGSATPIPVSSIVALSRQTEDRMFENVSESADAFASETDARLPPGLEQYARDWLVGTEPCPPALSLLHAGVIVATSQSRALVEEIHLGAAAMVPASVNVITRCQQYVRSGVTATLRRAAYDMALEFHVLWLTDKIQHAANLEELIGQLGLQVEAAKRSKDKCLVLFCDGEFVYDLLALQTALQSLGCQTLLKICVVAIDPKSPHAISPFLSLQDCVAIHHTLCHSVARDAPGARGALNELLRDAKQEVPSPFARHIYMFCLAAVKGRYQRADVWARDVYAAVKTNHRLRELVFVAAFCCSFLPWRHGKHLPGVPVKREYLDTETADDCRLWDLFEHTQDHTGVDYVSCVHPFMARLLLYTVTDYQLRFGDSLEELDCVVQTWKKVVKGLPSILPNEVVPANGIQRKLRTPEDFFCTLIRGLLVRRSKVALFSPLISLVLRTPARWEAAADRDDVHGGFVLDHVDDQHLPSHGGLVNPAQPQRSGSAANATTLPDHRKAVQRTPVSSAKQQVQTEIQLRLTILDQLAGDATSAVGSALSFHADILRSQASCFFAGRFRSPIENRFKLIDQSIQHAESAFDASKALRLVVNPLYNLAWVYSNAALCGSPHLRDSFFTKALKCFDELLARSQDQGSSWRVKKAQRLRDNFQRKYSQSESGSTQPESKVATVGVTVETSNVGMGTSTRPGDAMHMAKTPHSRSTAPDQAWSVSSSDYRPSTDVTDNTQEFVGSWHAFFAPTADDPMHTDWWPRGRID